MGCQPVENYGTVGDTYSVEQKEKPLEEKPLEEKALDLLEEAYKRSKYQEVGGRRLPLTFLDDDVALSVGLNPTPRETPEGVMPIAMPLAFWRNLEPWKSPVYEAKS